MRRTIEVKKGCVFYRGRNIGEPIWDILYNFKLRRSGKYLITITEGTQFRVSHVAWDIFYYIYSCNKSSGFSYKGLICRKAFNKLFFTLNKNKRYDITIKKIEEK